MENRPEWLPPHPGPDSIRIAKHMLLKRVKKAMRPLACEEVNAFLKGTKHFQVELVLAKNESPENHVTSVDIVIRKIASAMQKDVYQFLDQKILFIASQHATPILNGCDEADRTVLGINLVETILAIPPESLEMVCLDHGIVRIQECMHALFLQIQQGMLGR